MNNATHQITTSHFRFYVQELKGGSNVAFFKTLSEAVKAFPNATINVPEAMKKAAGINDQIAVARI